MLKRIADKYQIAIVLVHHLRKQEASDPHTKISGTTGLAGAADGTYVLCKEHPGDAETQLYVRGRDIEEKQFTLEQDIARFLPELGHYKLTELRPEIFRKYYTKLRNTVSEQTGKPLSEHTVEGVHACLCGILSDAMEGGFITHNPA